MHFFDIDRDQGKKTEKELQLKYGSNKVKFQQCDVGNGKQFEGTERLAKKHQGKTRSCTLF